MTSGLTHALHRAVQQHPTRNATVFGARRRSYLALSERVARLAGGLRAMGVARGDRVGILALNSDRYLEALLAVWWVGGVVNPANTRWSATELAFSFNDCATEVLFVDDTFVPLLAELHSKAPTLRACIHQGDGLTPDGLRSHDQLIDETPAIDDAHAAGSELAAVFYTGGTTGFPKGVMLSHEAFIGAVLSRLAIGYPVGPVYLHAAPMFHMVGVLGVLWQLANGGTHVMIPAFSPLAFMAAVQSERVSDTGLVPTMIQMVLDHPQFAQFDLDSWRFVIYGAAPISPALLERTIAALPRLQLTQAYGMTELTGPATYLLPSDHALHGDKLGTAGRAGPVALVRVVDVDGRECPRGTPGEIIVTSMTQMRGYWNRPQETADALRDGWMHTGDAGWMDEQGYLHVVDRLKDMIVSGGENVYSAEVENALAAHPAVAQSAVIGVPSPRWGEQVHAVVVLRPGAQVADAELIEHCRRLIATYKCPRSMEFREALPLSAAGKVLKHRLREPFWAGQARRVH